MEKYQRAGSGSTGRNGRFDEPKPNRSQQPKRVEEREELPPTAQSGMLKEDVLIEYKGSIINLGSKWLDIVREVDRVIEDRQLSLAVQICLIKRLNLSLPEQEKERIMSAYASYRALK